MIFGKKKTYGVGEEKLSFLKKTVYVVATKLSECLIANTSSVQTFELILLVLMQTV